MSLDQMIPIRQAAAAMGQPVKRLKALIQAGKMKAALDEHGEIIVSKRDTEMPDKSKFEHLRGQPITVTEASEKYNVNRRTIIKWVSKGHIKNFTKGERQRMQLDEADVAYCAAVYHSRGGHQGTRVLDEFGRPYQLSESKQATYRRAYRRKKKLAAQRQPRKRKL
jgi:hypothetical protein